MMNKTLIVAIAMIVVSLYSFEVEGRRGGGRGGRGGRRARWNLMCASSEECSVNSWGKRRICDVAKEVCVQCLADSDCTYNPKKSVCDNNKCIKPAPGNSTCTSSDECNVNARGRLGVCDVNKEACVQCLTDFDCTFNPKKSVCDNNKCIPTARNGGRGGRGGQRTRGSLTCASSEECNGKGKGKHRVCDMTKEVCIQCLLDTDCTFNPKKSVCNNNRCIKPARGQHARGSPTCTSSDECNVRARGRLGVCDLSKEECVQCLADSDCTFNPRKSLCDNNMCVGCIEDSDCADGFCSVRKCQAPLSTNATCITNAWCASGTCTNNICQ